ncbi:pantoate--beta-alanine ligase [Halobacillus litoralis]|uniref:pantoate--beta-alanine ligase n=1 Tax=Halobacillus litoralis TaxID=45668 RepID=UPI001CD4EDA8|nr:pantoate--beta-alanine ligase [Halobacillus litoralis]MCA0970373.1 pantoate--beta-alanine ligase [Halobacillus litoralis]
MNVFDSIAQVQEQTTKWVREGKTIGFVPTMGYLHEGHERLMEEARKENDKVILSIFVNPLQFGENEDLDQYPRDHDHDVSVAEKYGVDLVFLPTEDTMYPAPLTLNISVVRRADVLCGRSRPGHFEGVVTVLTKLFNICQPTRAYFGMKDAQQVAVVDGLIQDFNFPVQLVRVPTVREADGLAKSSRNVNLSHSEREEAPSIQAALSHATDLVRKGERNPEEIIQSVREFLDSRTRGKIDYIELLSYPELEPVHSIDQTVILAVAVYYEKARLIDNVVMGKDGVSELR